MKTKILLGSFIAIFLFIFFYLFGFLFPIFRDVNKLTTQFVSINVKDDQVEYKIVPKRPANWVSPWQNKVATRTIILSEDSSFYGHDGIDVEAIKDSIKKNLHVKKKLRGGSTITQQMVKNLFLTKDKTYTRKFNEILIALYVDRILSKQKILEIYINIIEYGKNLYGINKASHYYFQKPFGSINPKEAAFLAMLLPNPKKYSASFYRKQLSPYAKKIIKALLNKLTAVHAIAPEERDYYMTASLGFEITEEITDQLNSLEEKLELDDEDRINLNQLDE